MTGLLLDTHIFLWYSSDDPKLPITVHGQIEDEQGEVFLSSISAWEIAIKHGLGKLDLPQPIHELFDLIANGVKLLEPTLSDFISYSQLDFPIPNHRDPFDRMLAIQARNCELKLVTADRIFEAYVPDNLLLV